MNFVSQDSMSRFIYPLLAVFLIFAVAACESEPDVDEDDMEDMAEETMEDDAMMGNSIVDVAMADDRFSTLVTALQTAGLVETLKGTGPFTVFAPTNDAFAKLPAGTLEDLMKPENREKLSSILLYHVSSGSKMAEDVMGMAMIPTAQGSDLDVTESDGATMVGGANIVQTNVQADNGVIHAIDTVLMPEDMMMEDSM